MLGCRNRGAFTTDVRDGHALSLFLRASACSAHHSFEQLATALRGKLIDENDLFGEP